MNAQRDEVPIDALDGELARTIDRDLTLAAYWYLDPAIFALEQERIFKHSWRFVTYLDRLKNPGDRVIESVCDVPIVLVRGKDSELRGFVNVCPHRGSEVVAEDGSGRLLVCRYHGWSFELDGKLRGAPRSDRECGFDKDRFSLQPVRVDTWGPLVFVNLDINAPSFADTYQDFVAKAKAIDFDMSNWSYATRFEQIWECNWKILNENSMECYHCATSHPELTRVMKVGPDDYQMEAYRNYCYHFAPCTDAYKAQAGDKAEPWRLHHFWPSFVIFTGAPAENLAFGLNKLPVGPQQTRTVAEVWKAPDATAREVENAVKEWQFVLDQDRARTESVQRGLRSQRYRQRTLMMDSEYLIQHFQKHLQAELRDRSTTIDIQ